MMKTNDFHWIRRILACVSLFCLIVTSLEAQPVRASPPAVQDYMVILTWTNPWKKTICPGEYDAYAVFVVAPMGQDVPSAFYNATATVTGKVVQVKSKKYLWPKVMPGQDQRIHIEFTAKKPGHASLDVNVKVGMRFSEPLHVDFEVLKTCTWNVHGTADMTNVSGVPQMEGWEPVGIYDISGTIKVPSNGSPQGQGSATLFTDIFFTGSGEETCNHTTPWEGFTTVKIEADPHAWDDAGQLLITISIETLSVNATRVECKGPDDAYGYSNSPAVSVPPFTMKFNALPAEGGSTSLSFHFPNGQGQYQIELVVTPEEGES